MRAPWIGPTVATVPLPLSHLYPAGGIRSPGRRQIGFDPGWCSTRVKTRNGFDPGWCSTRVKTPNGVESGEEPEEAIEPSTTRLRSECSAAELLRRWRLG